LLLPTCLCLSGCKSDQRISPPKDRADEIARITEVKELTSILSEDPLALNRAAAALALGRLGDEQGVEPLIAALGDADAAVRRDITLALGQIKDWRVTAPLCGRLLHDNIADVRRAAARALHDSGDRKAMQCLVEALTDPNESVVYNAHRALIALTGRQDLGRSPSQWEGLIESE